METKGLEDRRVRLEFQSQDIEPRELGASLTLNAPSMFVATNVTSSAPNTVNLATVTTDVRREKPREISASEERRDTQTSNVIMMSSV